MKSLPRVRRSVPMLPAGLPHTTASHCPRSLTKPENILTLQPRSSAKPENIKHSSRDLQLNQKIFNTPAEIYS
ncbi:hypothetical protein RRG08_058347 [Elysia crispata]|uniref:Uncharacterized protein n=1 Tax=Elysia crispata TaxID=231223 RepID=A0AAE1A9W8_9GAST|nr:hypothetical protein RRG08_058347 [Elysia crispata]